VEEHQKRTLTPKGDRLNGKVGMKNTHKPIYSDLAIPWLIFSVEIPALVLWASFAQEYHNSFIMG